VNKFGLKLENLMDDIKALLKDKNNNKSTKIKLLMITKLI
jgi:hypothetical protein